MSDYPHDEYSKQQYGFPVTYSWASYMKHLTSLGAVQGEVGNHSVHPELGKMVRATHHLLAGGKFQITITESGDPNVMAELDAQFQKAWADANAVNSDAGHYAIGIP